MENLDSRLLRNQAEEQGVARELKEKKQDRNNLALDPVWRVSQQTAAGENFDFFAKVMYKKSRIIFIYKKSKK